ncbi:MAG TPA: 50S ribosomal protein L3 [Nitrospiraceae bacterium]|nr:MAG: 50S ribosomal protein L3 [Nitrospirae bacterium GWA2_46_11]OGW24672.1 MAG: 50S ribosomal protein L3 [Nitrospirae bacterium GWB2_47_37]HAK88107.1 50S ribosomal protein L3 [Nitrospiraceae bacterium]HCZ12265.1 50S ribosomal protein L3 [Nitrospiraceae bacterium]
MTGIIGKKLGMTQVFTEDGKMVPVTVVEAGPCCVVQVKTPGKDGYEAVKVGFIEAMKEKNISKPDAGVFKKAGTKAFKILKEFPMSGLNVGDMIKAENFNKGDVVTVSGISKGKGFQGVMKRHNFKGGPGSHGSMFNRAPGSIGASSFPSRVWRGIRMAGHMGSERVTVSNLTVVDVRPEQNLILIEGAVPGAANSILEILKK